MLPVSNIAADAASSPPIAKSVGQFRNILVHLALDGSADVVIGSAISLARLFAAHIDAVVALEHVNRPFGSGSIALQAAAAFEQTISTAADAIHEFEQAAEQAALSHGKRLIADKPELVERSLVRMARLYDLSIIIQPQGSPVTDSDAAPRPLLFESGRPVLLIPREHRDSIDLDRVAICWDGSRYAARAVHDAMPLLGAARAVDIIAVNEHEDDSTCSDALASHLGRRGLVSSVTRRTADILAIPAAIMSAVVDAGSGLVVMGGYGHSKAGKFVLGGVTRETLAKMRVPTFMSF